MGIKGQRHGRKLRVGLIFGGRSGEHEVSLTSARSIMAALDPERYDVVPVGITKEGQWITAGDPLTLLQAGLGGSDSRPAALLADPGRQALLELSQNGTSESVCGAMPIDVAFPVLHGPYGEDGTVQGLLELADIPFVGAGVLASALAMDKSMAKEVFKARGLPIVRHLIITRTYWEETPMEVIGRVEEEIGYSCFVKPSCLGSSVGITKAHNRSELRHAMRVAAAYDRKILVEEAIDGREIEVSVLGNDHPIASVPGEIIPCREFYDYRAKYIEDRSELLIPAPIPPALADTIRKLALEAYLAVDCAGLARVDFLLERETDAIYLNEINTLPGFTPISMFPKLWEASGISYADLVDRLIELALERHAEKSRSRTSYDPSLEDLGPK